MTEPDQLPTASSRVSPTVKTLALAAGLALASVPLYLHLRGVPHGHGLPWLLLVVAFAVAELLSVHIEINSEVHTFTLSEVPLALGLLFASPTALVFGRCVGAIAMLVVHDRQPVRKLAFNAAMFFAESTVALAVFRLLTPGGADVDRPAVWLATLAAVAVADVISIVAVSCAIIWHGARPEPGQLMLVGAITAFANTSVALTAGALAAHNPASIVLLGAVVGIVFATYSAYASLRQRYQGLQMLYDFTKVVSESLQAQSVLEAILDEARSLLHAEVAQINLRGGMTSSSSLRVVSGRDDSLALPSALLARLDASNEPVLVDVRTEPALGDVDVRHLLAAPLLGGGEVIGWLVVANRLGQVRAFDGDDLRLFATLANHASVALENGHLINRLRREIAEREHQALHDPLTDLPNRTLFLQRVDAMLDRGETGAVALLDLDRFKEINDTLGHHSGDLLLQHVANRIRASLPETGTVARLGGDEFALLLPATSIVDALAITEAVERALGTPIEVDEVSLEMRASIGIALAPEHGRDRTTLLRCADVAMYEAKTSGAHVVVYSSKHDHNTTERLRLAHEMRSAIDAGRIVAYFQPKADMATGHIIGAEALARWPHPQRGLVMPDEFIHVAEQSGLITEITMLVLDQALDQCRRWHDAGLELTVAVNLAFRSLIDCDLARDVDAALARHRLPASALTLEITESTIMADPQRSLEALERLAAMGVTLSVDDFGTGYSSLAYLQRLPVHEVKVDRSFVRQLSTDSAAATIVRSIIDLGHNLGLDVVAEGVEDRRCWDLLRTLGCNSAQGYFLSKPIPGALLTEWLLQREPVAVG
jgi:diguanylate cyclase (GGDEF)-like protein